MECQTNRMAGYCKRRLTTCYALLLVYSIGLKSIIELTGCCLFIQEVYGSSVGWRFKEWKISLDDGA